MIRVSVKPELLRWACDRAWLDPLEKKWFFRFLRTSGQGSVILRYFLPEPVKEECRQA